MLAAALEAEVDDYLTAHAAEGDEGGRRLVVGNGHARQRGVLTAAGVIPVRAPRVDDRRVDPVTGERVRFRSVILPPWCRKRPKVAEVLALLYLHGLSTGDFAPALAAFFGSAAGLSAAASVGCLAPGRPTTKPSASVTWPGGTRWTCGPMGSTSGSVWSRPTGAGWCWWACAPTAPRSWSRSPTGNASRPSRGRSCWGICVAAGCKPRWWRSATARWAVGRPARCLASHPPAARLGPQARQCAQRLAQGGAGRRAEGVGRDPGCTRPRPRRARDRAVRR
jgi:hypothetical protein